MQKMGRQKSKTIFSYAMMFPYLFFFLFLTVIPIISSVILSFTHFNMLQAPRFVGLENYLNLFLDDDIFLIAIRNTVALALITGPFGYVMSFIFAWMINELGKTLRTMLTIVFYGPSIATNMFMIWLFIFSGDSYGLLNGWMLRFGLIKEPIVWLQDARYTTIAVVVVMVWMSMGAGFLAFIAGLQTTDKSLAEAGAIDGIHNRWQELWLITVPQMGPQLMFGAVMAIAASFSTGYISMEITGFPSVDYSTHTIVTHVYDFGYVRFEMGYASAIAVILFIIVVLTKQLISKVLSKYM